MSDCPFTYITKNTNVYFHLKRPLTEDDFIYWNDKTNVENFITDCPWNITFSKAEQMYVATYRTRFKYYNEIFKIISECEFKGIDCDSLKFLKNIRSVDIVVTYNFKGCRTQEQKQKRIEDARLAIEQKINGDLGKEKEKDLIQDQIRLINKSIKINNDSFVYNNVLNINKQLHNIATDSEEYPQELIELHVIKDSYINKLFEIKKELKEINDAIYNKEKEIVLNIIGNTEEYPDDLKEELTIKLKEKEREIHPNFF